MPLIEAHVSRSFQVATQVQISVNPLYAKSGRPSIDPLVFVDEMGVHTSVAPLYGYSREGERVRLKVPRNRGRNTTLLASITLLGGMGETMVVEGSTSQEVFEAYVEYALAPTLEGGQVVILDNLCAHKPARVRELIEE